MDPFRRIAFRIAAFLYRRAFLVYRPLYFGYKAITDRRDRSMASNYIREGSMVVDVGANIGSFARFAARKVGSSGRVVAFEPSRQNHDRLLVAAVRYPQIEPVHAALASHVGTVTLYVSNELNVDHQTYDSGEGREQVTVPCSTLDEWLDGEPIDLIKIDVQGFELSVVQGMLGTLRANDDIAVLFEYWPSGLRRAGTDPGLLLETFRELGFSLLFSGSGGWLDAEPELGEGHFDYLTVAARRPNEAMSGP
jgi:FkbM family methyltransferase